MQGNGAKTASPMPPDDFDDLSPPDDTAPKVKLVGITARFTVEEAAEIKFIADLWTAQDRAAKRGRRKWKQASIIRHAVRVLRNSLAAKVADWPTNEAEQLEFIRRQVAARKAQSKGSKQDKK